VSFPTASAIERLQGVSALKLIGDAADLATAIAQKPRAAPAAYVVHQRQGEPPIGVSNGVLLQNIRVSVQVVLFVSHAGTAESGSSARRVMDALQADVDARLMVGAPTASRASAHCTSSARATSSTPPAGSAAR